MACAACCEAAAAVVFLNKLFAGFEGWASLFDVAFCCDEVTFFDVVVVVSSFLPDASVDVLFAAPFFALSVFLALPGYCFYSTPVSLLWAAALADDVVLAEAGGLNFRREEFGGLWSQGGFRRPVLLLLCLDSGRCGCYEADDVGCCSAFGLTLLLLLASFEVLRPVSSFCYSGGGLGGGFLAEDFLDAAVFDTAVLALLFL